MILFLFALVVFSMLALMITAAVRDNSKRIALIKPGSVWTFDSEGQNPFKYDYHEYVVLEVKNGYVLFQDTKHLIKYTSDVGSFICFHTLLSGVKS